MKHNRAVPVALMFLAAAARAESNGALTITPAVVTVHGQLGQSATQRLVLTNNTPHEHAFELVAEDVIVKDGRRSFVPAGEIDGSIAATAIFSRNYIVIRPGETTSIDVTVSLPRAARHRGVVAIFRGATTSIGTMLTFSLSDDVAVDAGPLTVTPQTAIANLGVRQSCSNNGHEPVVAHGVASILDPKGVLVGQIELEPRRLFPSENATIEGEYGGELQRGRYRVMLTFDLGGRKTLTRTAEVHVR